MTTLLVALHVLSFDLLLIWFPFGKLMHAFLICSARVMLNGCRLHSHREHEYARRNANRSAGHGQRTLWSQGAPGSGRANREICPARSASLMRCRAFARGRQSHECNLPRIVHALRRLRRSLSLLRSDRRSRSTRRSGSLKAFKQAYKREARPFSLSSTDFSTWKENRLPSSSFEDWQELLYDSCTMCGRCSTRLPDEHRHCNADRRRRDKACSNAGLVPQGLTRGSGACRRSKAAPWERRPVCSRNACRVDGR